MAYVMGVKAIHAIKSFLGLEDCSLTGSYSSGTPGLSDCCSKISTDKDYVVLTRYKLWFPTLLSAVTTVHELLCLVMLYEKLGDAYLINICGTAHFTRPYGERSLPI